MKVLFVFYVPSGGMETLNRSRCRALRHYGIEADCLYYEWGAGLQNASGFPLYVTCEDHEIQELLQERAYDVIVVTSDYLSFERFRRLGFTGKLVLEIQGYSSKEVAREQLTLGRPAILAHASALLNPNTPYIAALFKELFAAIPQFHFNNCIDTASFTYQKTDPPAAPAIAWIGRLEDNKNWREFLYLGHSLTYDYPQLELWMFEDSNLSIASEREKFVELTKRLGLEQRLKLLANVPNHDMRAFYSLVGDSGGFLCSTSKVEGAPLSVLEAMSCRCPVLATNSDGTASTIIHNVTGKNYVQGDMVQAVREARELMQNAKLRSRIRGRAQAHVREGFNLDVYCHHFIQMLKAI
ncbi:glycosyl transferase family 1 [Paenibacillus sp. CAA11]|uniref:glycosyltransferase family 4 protein n=1 Tax=Paenibacillus sp. CAA11 TaxID=1532905 RepID=UPI000D3C0E60|nr:glycosyltransferase family 4 protein [Paenibacillus sp. CAA11]AWB45822.1 glycosyl transferase family 1 [Paenibacillus sp. CAA11]